MRAAFARLRVDQAGITLSELLVAMSILGVVMLVFTTTLASVQRVVVKEDNLGQANDQARLALQQLDREVRSGNVLYQAASGGFEVKVYTQANLDTRGEAVCKLWKVTKDEELTVTTWSPGNEPDPTASRIVATGIVNATLDPAEPAFALDPDPLKKSRTLIVTFAVNPDLDRFPGSTVRIRGSITGRNTSYGYPEGICA